MPHVSKQNIFGLINHCKGKYKNSKKHIIWVSKETINTYHLSFFTNR